MSEALGSHEYEIRPERAGDADHVRAVHEAAFSTREEALLVDALRAAGRLCVSLVAVEGGPVVGHIGFSPVQVEGAVGSAVGLAPLAVLPAHQRQGIGSALVRAGLAACERAGYSFVVVIGSPAYYGRFGFQHAGGRGLANEFRAGEAFQVLELRPGALPPGGGLVQYTSEFSGWEVLSKRSLTSMKTAFSQVFWGLFLVILDITINRFDVLPDIIGYALVAVGAGGLGHLSSRFGWASLLGCVLAAFQVAGFLGQGEALYLLRTAEALVDCCMMWTLLGGIIEHASARGRGDLARAASNRRLAYVALKAAFLYIASLGPRKVDQALGLLLVIATIVMLFMILDLIYRVRHALLTREA